MVQTRRCEHPTNSVPWHRARRLIYRQRWASHRSSGTSLLFIFIVQSSGGHHSLLLLLSPSYMNISHFTTSATPALLSLPNNNQKKRKKKDELVCWAEETLPFAATLVWVPNCWGLFALVFCRIAGMASPTLGVCTGCKCRLWKLPSGRLHSGVRTRSYLACWTTNQVWVTRAGEDAAIKKWDRGGGTQENET